MKKKSFRIILLLIALVIPSICIVRYIRFDQQCAGFLKQAADASSVELAERQLSIAIDYIEKHDLTSGYTSVLYNTEDENVGFWYENLKTCQKELLETKNNSTLENTNVLMKLRESLTDVSKHGTVLTLPDGISRYPYNLWFMAGNLISTTILILAVWPLIKLYIEMKMRDDEEDEEDEEEEAK